MSEITFESWYASYPRKAKPRDARKAWAQTLKRGVSPAQIQASTEIMMATEWRGRTKDYIPYPASFLRGEEFLDFEETRVESLEDEEPAPREHKHWCKGCLISHEWACAEPLCILPGHAYCKVVARVRQEVRRVHL